MSIRKLLARFVGRMQGERKLNAVETAEILAQPGFRRAAEKERLRVFRTRTTLSIVFFQLPPTEFDIPTLAGELNVGLEVIDTIGWVDGGQVGVLLPGLWEDDARSWAESRCLACAEQGIQLSYGVVAYPEEGDRIFRQGTGSGRRQELDVWPANAEAFFAIPLPKWKRTIDVVGALVGLIVASPILLAASLLIKLTSRGPVVFGQEREGLGGRRFLMYKLRTMVAGAEGQKQALWPLNESDGPVFKMNADPRITTVGRILRKLSIDELPQLVNVLKGDMSLVGPRPLPTAESRGCELWHRKRLDVTPGMTGIWQVRGRNRVSFEQWMRMDVEYVDNRSLGQDLRLLLATIPAVILCRGAQ